MKSSSLKNQTGLSLIELMIAVALGIFITAGIIQLFISSKHTYRIQENISRLQESGRFAVSFLNRDIRMADYWGCLGNTDSIENNLNPGSGFDDFAKAVGGTNNTGVNGSDSITVRGALSSSIYVTDVPATVSADIKVTGNSNLLEKDIVLVSDCEMGNIFQITNISSNNTDSSSRDNVVHNTGGTYSPGNLTKDLQKKYGLDAQVYKVGYITYSIQVETGNTYPSLYRSINGASAQPLIEGIENMQIKYGIDTDGDFAPNYYTDAPAAATDTDGEALNDELMEKVVSVRVYLVAVTLDDNLTINNVPYTLIGEDKTSTDGKIRRVFTTTIALRNRLP